MNITVQRWPIKRRNLIVSAALMATAMAGYCPQLWSGQETQIDSYRVLTPSTQGYLMVFPIVSDKGFDTHNLLTLDEGIRSGEVTVTERGASTGLVRPRFRNPVVSPGWTEQPLQLPDGPVTHRGFGGASVNELVLVNNSDKALLLLAGEIVTGGKQDRVVGKDRIVPAHGEPISLDVFCVEPHRWTSTSTSFGALSFSMAQPSVRQEAMSKKDQQAVWDAVAQSKTTVSGVMPAPVAQVLDGTSSYAKTMQNRAVQERVDAFAAPIERSYDKLAGDLRSAKAVGAVVAVNGEIVWADVFASPALLEKYWAKLVRSYATEALSTRIRPAVSHTLPTIKDAEAFLHDLGARRESVESEPGVYRLTDLLGANFEAFVLTSLLPGPSYAVHVAKMRQK